MVWKEGKSYELDCSWILGKDPIQKEWSGFVLKAIGIWNYMPIIFPNARQKKEKRNMNFANSTKFDKSKSIWLMEI